MYESFFDLKRQPFLAAPDADFFAAIESVTEVRDALIRCIRGGQGVGALCAPAGTGKSMMCQTLIDELADEYAIILLPNSHFSTRRSLLQAILYELGNSYAGLSEQELRLEMQSAFKSIRNGRAGVVLLIDEAHLLSTRLLEEVRTITNLVDRGRSLCCVILSGQLQLEEKLAAPELSALNQRISCQVSLPQLTRMESAEYLLQRLAVAGADLSRVFTREAVQAICQASDGLPRCLNQLADQALLLASLDEQQPVTRDHVLVALEDLKQLPLHWNEPVTLTDPVEQLKREAALGHHREEAATERATARFDGRHSDIEFTGTDHATEPTAEEEPAAAAFEVGAGIGGETESADTPAGAPASHPTTTPDNARPTMPQAPAAEESDDGFHSGVVEIGGENESGASFEVGAPLTDSTEAGTQIDHDPYDEDTASLDAPSVLADDGGDETDTIADTTAADSSAMGDQTEETEPVTERYETEPGTGIDESELVTGVEQPGPLTGVPAEPQASDDSPQQTMPGETPIGNHSEDRTAAAEPAAGAGAYAPHETASSEPADRTSPAGFIEQPVLDRYAIIDSGGSLDEIRDLPPTVSAPRDTYDDDDYDVFPDRHSAFRGNAPHEPVAADRSSEQSSFAERRDPIGRIDQMFPMIEAALSEDRPSEHHPAAPADSGSPVAHDLEEQIQAEVLDSCRETQQAISDRLQHGELPPSGSDSRPTGEGTRGVSRPASPAHDLPLTAFDIVHPEPETGEEPPAIEHVRDVTPPVERESEPPAATTTPENPPAESPGQPDSDVQAPSGPRPLAHLFSSLRRRHRQA